MQVIQNTSRKWAYDVDDQSMRTFLVKSLAFQSAYVLCELLTDYNAIMQFVSKRYTSCTGLYIVVNAISINLVAK